MWLHQAVNGWIHNRESRENPFSQTHTLAHWAWGWNNLWTAIISVQGRWKDLAELLDRNDVADLGTCMYSSTRTWPRCACMSSTGARPRNSFCNLSQDDKSFVRDWARVFIWASLLRREKKKYADVYSHWENRVRKPMDYNYGRLCKWRVWSFKAGWKEEKKRESFRFSPSCS